MSTRLVILGLLQDHPMYGYELKSVIEDQMADWTSIAFGSIYFALNKLSEEGLIVKAATEKEGNRPSRSVYEITDKGRKEFLQLLRSQWTNVKLEQYDLDIALFFQEYLSTRDIIPCLKTQITAVENAITHLETNRHDMLTTAANPQISASILDHKLIHLKAELEWLNTLKKRFPGA